jgi:hypothetical protein
VDLPGFAVADTVEDGWACPSLFRASANCESRLPCRSSPGERPGRAVLLFLGRRDGSGTCSKWQLGPGFHVGRRGRGYWGGPEAATPETIPRWGEEGRKGSETIQKWELSVSESSVSGL